MGVHVDSRVFSLGHQIGTDKSRPLSLVLVCKETRGLTPKKESGKIIGIPRRFFRKKKNVGFDFVEYLLKRKDCVQV